MKLKAKNIMTMRWIMLAVLFAIHYSLFTSSAGAQTFTQRVQQKGNAGEGKVTVSHDKTIDDLVNGSAANQPVNSQSATPTTTTEKRTDDKPVVPKTDAEKAREEVRRIMEQTPDTAETVIDTRRKVMRGGYKINGYRVQAFAGGNQRKDRQKAEHIGNTIKASYPEEPIYVHFYSPRWICRVGNYRTYEEAYQMLMNIRKLGISGASIVKGKITVQY